MPQEWSPQITTTQGPGGGPGDLHHHLHLLVHEVRRGERRPRPVGEQRGAAEGAVQLLREVRREGVQALQEVRPQGATPSGGTSAREKSGKWAGSEFVCK